MLRLVKLLDIIIPLALGSFILYGSLIGIFQVGLGRLYLHERRVLAAGLYIASALISSTMTLYLYAKLVFHRPPTPPLQIPEAYITKTIYETIDKDGSIPRCTKDMCQGRWKPPRTHHCSICRDCRLGFDHHCHWVGNCVTMETRKIFLSFMGLASFTILILVLPVAPLLWKHATVAWYTSLSDPWAYGIWWNRWYSWILVAGPLGRWPVGIGLGFRILQEDNQWDNWRMGSMINEPNLTVFVMVQVAILLACFMMGLLITGIRDALQGRTTFDRIVVNPQGVLYWIPAQEGERLPGTVVACPPTINAYDLGYQSNWANLMQRPLFGPCQDRDVIPALDESLLRNLMQAYDTQ